MSETLTLSRGLVSLIREKGITDADQHRAVMFTLDAVANALAGRNTEPGRKLLDWGAKQGNDAGRHAFVIGGLTHILETDDLHRESVTHPGCVVVPAVLALTEGRKITGREILTAVLHGYEAMCRIGNAVGPAHYVVWHNTATCGPYGSAMAAATLEFLNNEQAVHALGNAGTQSSGFWQFLETGAMSKHLHAGRAAESGIVAAQLAALDFTGPPAVLEGSKGFFAAACPDAQPAAVLANPDKAWELTLTSIKPWPSCRHTHPAVDAAMELSHLVADKTVNSVLVETYQAALDVCERPQPQSEYAAKFSLHHTVAAALTEGRIGFDSFDERARSGLRDVRSRISIVAAEPFVSAYPNSWGARVTVTTDDGNAVSAERKDARGDPEHALDDDAMISKAKMLLKFADFDEALAQKTIDDVLNLPESQDAADTVTFLVKRLLQA